MNIIHVRLRTGLDDDLATWYEAQDNKSGAVREAIRTAIRLQNGETLEAVVREAIARELACIPDVVATAVKETLATYHLTRAEGEQEAGAEDPELAARLDAQLDDFWGKEQEGSYGR